MLSSAVKATEPPTSLVGTKTLKMTKFLHAALNVVHFWTVFFFLFKISNLGFYRHI